MHLTGIMGATPPRGKSGRMGTSPSVTIVEETRPAGSWRHSTVLASGSLERKEGGTRTDRGKPRTQSHTDRSNPKPDVEAVLRKLGGMDSSVST